MQPKAITLGDRVWTVRPLTLAQVQDVEQAILDGAHLSKGNVGTALGIVAIALRRDNPEDAKTLGEVEATAPEISVAMTEVLKLGGFTEDTTPGEAEAGATPAPIGDGSTPA
jgi:hypothetical protein